MTRILHSYPYSDGFYMPAEFSKHSATVMIWPYRPGSWGNDTEASENAFLRVINEIKKSEKVYLLVDKEHADDAVSKAGTAAEILIIENNDAWARDTCPTFLTDGRYVRGVSWSFNAWGGTYDGLYSDYESDDKIAKALCSALSCPFYDADDFVLEGGSIHSDGEGTVMVTESCLLSPGRNPLLSKEQIEYKLRMYLGASKVLWLPQGIYNDETNGHVDNICAFTSPGRVVLAWTDRKEDPQYEMSISCLEYLSKETDAKGRHFNIIRLPIPDHPVCLTDDDCTGFSFAPGEAERYVGERLAASYVNFYFTNEAVLVPQFGGRNTSSDVRALKLLGEECTGRKIIGIPASIILKGGGNIHCITQQIPEGEMK